MRYDTKAIKDYLKREGLARMDVRYIFSTGDLVLQKQRQPTKQRCRATGPFVFVSYVGTQGVVAKIRSMKGREYQVSAANILPLNTTQPCRMLRHGPWNL